MNPANSALPEILSGLAVLLIEDNPTNLLVAKALLERMGAEVTAVDNGEDGLNAANERPFDLIFMDCVMPDMDGFEVTERIRADEQNPNRESTIIALTANAFEEDKERCFDAGMNDFIEKPLRPQHVIATLEHWVG